MKKLCLGIAVSFLLLGAFSAAAEEERYPSIHHAIAALERTKQELETGEHGFGGHRSQAIEHIDGALKELHLALAYADAHPDKIVPAH